MHAASQCAGFAVMSNEQGIALQRQLEAFDTAKLRGHRARDTREHRPSLGKLSYVESQ
jgi:hypothetical protein